MKKIFFALPGNEIMADLLISKQQGEKGVFTLRHFPDGETYLRILSEVKNKEVIIVCTLNQPDDKLLPLYFLSKNCKDLGAKKIVLIAPYLAYMRQDTIFNPGEAVTSTYFASLLCGFIDSLITIDPHLHRRSTLSEIYNIPTKVAHAANHISDWVKKKVATPLFIGPDSESEQWVAKVANDAAAPFLILSKIRYADDEVVISIPDVALYKNHTPILVDDIISTGGTMMATIKHLKDAKMQAPICIGVHPLFAGNAYQDLLNAGASTIISCNTIQHESNQIDISDLLFS
jgi:ribose-phosphate pyrophosphokinase